MVSTVHLSDEDEARFLPVHPNWSTPLKYAYEFKTDIITSWDGKEQRRAARWNPRMQLSFAGNVHGPSKLALDYYMATWLTKKTLIPDYITFLDIVIEMEAEATSAVVVGDLSWITPGMTVAVYDRQGRMETREVLTKGTNSIVFFDATTTVFAVGSRISPIFEGYIQATPKPQRVTSGIVAMAVQFDVEPGSFDYTPPDGDSYAGFREFFGKKPDWSGGVGLDVLWPRETVDYGFGQVSHFVPYQFPARITRMNFVGRDKGDVKKAVDFFRRHRGRWKEFVVPTWENDVPYAFIGAGSKSILIDGQNFGSVYRDSSVFKRIVLRMADGRVVHNAVDFVEALSETDTSVLWTKDDLPTESLTPETLNGISWGLVGRFATDRLEIDWLTDTVAQFSMTFQSLENFDL